MATCGYHCATWYNDVPHRPIRSARWSNGTLGTVKCHAASMLADAPGMIGVPRRTTATVPCTVNARGSASGMAEPFTARRSITSPCVMSVT